VKHLTVKFRDFWPGFVPEDFFIPLLAGLAPDLWVKQCEQGPVDLEVVSVFDSRGQRTVRAAQEFARHAPRRIAPIVNRWTTPPEPDPEARVSIWYTGENIRPPIGDWDLTLSFDADSIRAKNRYLPLWWLLLPELLMPASAGPVALERYAHLPTLEGLLSARSMNTGGRPGFVCTIIGNPEPVRMRAIGALREIGDVDVYGRLTGRPVPSKQDVMQDYRFTLCFENDAYPGYVTEKLIDAWSAGCVPLWSGLDQQGYVNPAAVVNLMAHNALDDFCEAVSELDKDRASITAKASQPLLRRRPDLTGIRGDIHRLLIDAGIL
jgi:hypothetical protein